jgi:PAB1-binding protein PBP1
MEHMVHSVKRADRKQADQDPDPEAHVVEKPPSSANLFQRFTEEKYNKFFFDLVHGIHPYEEEEDPSEDEVTR